MSGQPTDDPACFYTGLVADLYASLRAVDPEPATYERFIRRYGEPALELACGDGDPLLELLALGLDVHGLDASADMLARCRARAAAMGLEPTLFLEKMQTMRLPFHYRSIFLAGGSFNLLPDDATGSQTLQDFGASKQKVNAAKSWIKVGLNNVSFLLYPERPDFALVSFVQDYQSNNLNDRTAKRQFWSRENGRWKIIHETSL